MISRKTVEINLNKVESPQVDQGMLGRMLDFGTLVIAGTGASHEPIVGIAEPLEFRKAFISAQDAGRSEGGCEILAELGCSPFPKRIFQTHVFSLRSLSRSTVDEVVIQRGYCR